MGIIKAGHTAWFLFLVVVRFMDEMGGRNLVMADPLQQDGKRPFLPLFWLAVFTWGIIKAGHTAWLLFLVVVRFVHMGEEICCPEFIGPTVEDVLISGAGALVLGSLGWWQLRRKQKK